MAFQRTFSGGRLVLPMAVASNPQIRFCEHIVLGPAEGGVAQPLLNMEWNQTSKKYILARSLVGFIILLADTVEKVRSKLALTPGGGSYVKIRPALNRFTGSLGLISQVRNSLNPAWAWMECSFFSRVTSHEGAKCTFFSSTHFPDLTAVLMALSASLNPSADPIAMEVTGLFISAAKSSTLELAS